MKSGPSFAARAAMYGVFILLVFGYIVLRVNPQGLIPREVVLMGTTLAFVALILRAGEPVVRIVRLVLPAYSRLGVPARIGFGLFVLGVLVLLMSVPADLLFDWFGILLPVVTAVYCIGLFLVQRELPTLGATRYNRNHMGLSLLFAMFGVMSLQSTAFYSAPEWVWTVTVWYFILIFPVAFAIFIVREETPRNSS